MWKGSWGTIRTPAVCGRILLQFSEKSPQRLSKVSHFFDLSCAGNLWSSRIEQLVKRWKLTYLGRAIEIEFEISKRLTKNILFCQLGFFKRDEISSKKSIADVWPAVGCVRIRAFQRRSNFWKRDEMLEFWAKWLHKVPKSCRSIGLFSGGKIKR